ncbi:MAG: 2-C-methyl-D-erythritol 4-phosphate cytidylyltransferase [Phycisphaerae bacterium]
MATPKASVILAAAGAGRRFAEGRADTVPGGGKVFASLAGRPVLAHALEAFARVEAVVEVVVAVPAGGLDAAREQFGESLDGGRPLAFVAGGETRPESVQRALEATDEGTELVAVHDGARPLIRPAVIEEALRVAVEHGAAVVGRPVDHTIKMVAEDGRVTETVPRRTLWMAQTPQVFRREIIAQAYARRGDMVGRVTDDAQLVEALGKPVRMVRGDAANIKITTPEDLRACEALLAAGWPFEA